MSVLSVEKLTKLYKGKDNPAVNNISFKCMHGRVFALLGMNGSGKTTTIKSILGLVRPTSGEIFIDGVPIRTNYLFSRTKKQNMFGAILEGERNLYFQLNALDNLIYFGRSRGMPKSEARQRAQSLLAEYELPADQPIFEFSSGMKQKTSLAAALIHNPDIIFLDEPTLGLDVVSRKALEEKISNLSENGKTIILTSHELDVVERLADDVMIIREGKTVLYGTKNNLLSEFKGKTYFHIKLHNPQGQNFQIQNQWIQDNCSVTINPLDVEILSNNPNVFEHMSNLKGRIISVDTREPSLEDLFILMNQ